MKLDDKASDSPDIDLVRQSAPGAYRLLTDELVGADELTGDDEFPKYGDFLKVGRLRSGDEGPEVAGERFIECPTALAKWLVENVDLDDDFRIQSVRKVDGEWQYNAEIIDD